MLYSFRDILSALRSTNGRLFPEMHDPKNREALKRSPLHAGTLAQLRKAADEAASHPPTMLTYRLFADFERNGARRPYEAPYFHNRGLLMAAVLVYLTDGREELLETIHDYIWALCDDYTWALPAHVPIGIDKIRSFPRTRDQIVDLFAAETSMMLAEVDSLVGDRIDPQVRDRLQAEVQRRILKPYFENSLPFGWESAASNWAAVCSGAAGTAALYYVKDPDRLAGIVYRVQAAMDSFLSSYGDDGACVEGPGYWEYGFGFYVYFAELLRERTEGKLDMLAGDKISAMADYPAAVTLSGGLAVNFSDAGPRLTPRAGLRCRMTDRLGATPPPLEKILRHDDDHCHRWAPLTRDLFWAPGAVTAPGHKVGLTYLPDAQWLIDKRVDGGSMFALAAKGGHNAEPHNHNDVGSFILHAGGESFIFELGAGLYTRQYFGPQRYEFIHNGSQGHSVPVVNGLNQGTGKQYYGQVLTRGEADGATFMDVEMAAAYPDPTLKHLRRSFRWIHPVDGEALLLLTDAFAFDTQPKSLEEVFISIHEPSVADAGTVVWGAGPSCTLTYDAAMFAASVEKIETTWHLGDPLTVYRTVLTVKQPALEMTAGFRFAASR